MEVEIFFGGLLFFSWDKKAYPDPSGEALFVP